MRVKESAIQFSAAALIGLAVASCGSSSKSSSTASAGGGSPSQSKRAQQAPGGAPQAPSEAQAAATGDIPDSQNFLTFHNSTSGYSIRYPEGWTQKRNGSQVTFSDKANVIWIVVTKGATPSAASATADLAKLKASDPSVKAGKAQQVKINGAPVIKVTYTRRSPPDPVTGKRLPLTIDRYVYARNGRVAIVDLGTPVGVDNVDAYRMISKSFRWQ